VIVEGTGGHGQRSIIVPKRSPIGAVADALVLLIGAQQTQARRTDIQLHHAKVGVHAGGQDEIGMKGMRLQPPDASAQVQLRQSSLHGPGIEQTQLLIIAAREQMVLVPRMT